MHTLCSQKRRKSKYESDAYFKFWCKVQPQSEVHPKDTTFFLGGSISKKLNPTKWEDVSYFPQNLEVAHSKDNLTTPARVFPKGAPDYILGLYLNEFKVSTKIQFNSINH
jgi:hypothetical protein